MSPTDEEIAGLLARLNHPIKYLGFGADRVAQHSPLQREAADALKSLQSDLSAAMAEIAGLEAALNQIVYLRPVGPTRNKLVKQMERIALEALCASRTKGEQP